MMKNYNPYVVPEGFFEESKKNAVRTHNRRVRTLKYAALSVAVVAALLVVPVFVRQQVENSQRQECAANNLAQMYDYDVFLQVNF